jgi:hypothetical protein
VFGHKPIGKLSHRGRATFARFPVRRIVAVRYLAEDDFGALSGTPGAIFPTAAMVYRRTGAPRPAPAR